MTATTLPDEPVRLLTRAQVADILRVSDRTLANLLRAGDIPFVRVGVTLQRFRPADVEAYLERRTGAPQYLAQ
jgi:excisionase family DNA binding protein